MHARRFLLFFLLIVATPAFNQSLAQTQKGGQEFPFVFDILGASLFTDEIIIGITAMRTDIPTSGSVQVNVSDLVTGESSHCVSANFDLIINRGHSNLFFITEAGFNCEIGEPILVECKVTDESIISERLFVELFKSSNLGQQSIHGRSHFYRGLACDLKAFGFEDIVEGFAFTARDFGTPSPR